MAEQNKIRASFRIIYKNARYYVVKSTYTYKEAFTTQGKAEEFLEQKYREKVKKYINKLMREMKKIEDVAKRTRRYKRICRIKSQLLELS